MELFLISFYLSLFLSFISISADRSDESSVDLVLRKRTKHVNVFLSEGVSTMTKDGKKVQPIYYLLSRNQIGIPFSLQYHYFYFLYSHTILYKQILRIYLLIFLNFTCLFHEIFWILTIFNFKVEVIPEYPISIVLIRDKMAAGVFEKEHEAEIYPYCT